MVTGWCSWPPNLARDEVAFDASLNHPLEFREAISALHDVVINDLRYVPRDKTQYEAWLSDQRVRESRIRTAAMDAKRDEIWQGKTAKPSADLKRAHADALKRYWVARRTLNKRLKKEK